ncbi:MAG: hypothetical protein ACK5QD_10215, partial [Brevundimonas sp.]|uniref:hypothetical protein n=1 Tax=Brevundimonas sp. TaxID=1871086 RepID=UPI0039187E27
MRSMPMACPTRVLSLAAAGLLAAGPAVASEAGPAMRPGAVVSGAVAHTTDELLFGLDAGSGSDGSGGVIAASLAGGRV